jgi:hypothetical protein
MVEEWLVEKPSRSARPGRFEGKYKNRGNSELQTREYLDNPIMID